MNTLNVQNRYLTRLQCIRILEQNDIAVVSIKKQAEKNQFSEYFPWTIRFIKAGAEIVKAGPTLPHLIDRILYEFTDTKNTERELVVLTNKVTKEFGGIRMGRFGWIYHTSLLARRNRENVAHTFEIDYDKQQESLVIWARNRKGNLASLPISNTREVASFIRLHS